MNTRNIFQLSKLPLNINYQKHTHTNLNFIRLQPAATTSKKKKKSRRKREKRQQKIVPATAYVSHKRLKGLITCHPLAYQLVQLF